MKGEIPWEGIGKSLEELLRYERRIGHYEHAGYDLIAALVHGTGSEAWRAFVLDAGHFAAMVDQVLAISRQDGATPREALDAIRTIVEAVWARHPEDAAEFLDAYLARRPDFPIAVRGQLDQFAIQGDISIPLDAAVFAAEVGRARPLETQGEAERAVFGHWYDRIVRGEVTGPPARAIPTQILDAEARLWAHLREISPELPREIDRAVLYGHYAGVFKAEDIPGLSDLVIAAEKSRLNLEVEQVESFRKNLSLDEAGRRFEILGAWLAQINRFNHDGVVLTPVLTRYLAQPSDFEALLGELKQLREETRAGRFCADNPLQRELEYMRFATECCWLFDEPRDTPEQYARFKELEVLPPPEAYEKNFVLDGQHLVEVRRIAGEAAGFLNLLREFRARTSRPIVVVGNDRYGRQWIVEPLEDYLRDGFILRYFRNPSHKSMRLTVRHQLYGHIRMGFTRDFVLELGELEPHVVIADSCSPRGGGELMCFSRGTRDFVNWFMAFNDVRAGGDSARYEAESSLPPGHLTELKKWHEFVRVRRQLQDWVGPGPTYSISHWAPVLKERVLLGDFRVLRKDPDLDDDRPQVIVANPAIYLDDGDEVPEVLRRTSPYYFDGPERYEKEEVVFGFGPHGFETRLAGASTDTFVAAVQRQMKKEIDELLKKTQEGERVWIKE